MGGPPALTAVTESPKAFHTGTPQLHVRANCQSFMICCVPLFCGLSPQLSIPPTLQC